ncbi:MAG: hypothetical protein ACOC79_04490 [Thermodesulfobacteriota bacterium]
MVLDNKAHLTTETGVEAVYRELRDGFQTAGIPVYPGTERALRGIRHALTARRNRKEDP